MGRRTVISREFWDICKAHNMCYSVVYDGWVPLPEPSNCSYENHVFNRPASAGDYCQCHFAVAISTTEYISFIDRERKLI